MCGDLIERLTVEACEIAAPIIHSQWRGENHDLPAHWMHFVVQPGKIFRAVGDVPLIWDDNDGLCWITDNLDEVFDDGGNITDLREYRDAVRRFAAWCWTTTSRSR